MHNIHRRSNLSSASQSGERIAFLLSFGRTPREWNHDAKDHDYRHTARTEMDLARSAVQAVGGRSEREMETTRSTQMGRKCTVDLEDVISVDTQGEGVLLEMVTEGAALFATRAYMKHILESLHLSPNSARKDEQ